MRVEREQLDNWCEKGILALMLAVLAYSPLAFGAVPVGGFDYFVVVEWLTVAIVAVWFARFCINPKHRLLWPPVCWGVLAFVAYAVGRYATAEIEFIARQELIKVLVYGILFCVVVNNLHRQETTQTIGVGLIFIAMMISLYAVFQFLASHDFVWDQPKPEGYRKRGSGTFICPNHLAGYLEMIFPLAVLFTITGRFKPLMKIFLGYATLAIFAGISVTISRGGWLATAISLAVLFIWLIRQKDYWKRAVIVLGALVLIFGAFFWKAGIGPERRERFDAAIQIEDVRFQIWKPAVEMWKDHLWFGVGPAHFDSRFRQYRTADPAIQARPERVHNDYLNTLVDWGLVGALIVLACWALFYYQVFRVWKFVQRSQNDLGAKRSNKTSFVAGGSIGLLAILVHSVFDFNMYIPANAILAVTLMAIVASHYRFAGERHWHTVRWPLRIPVLLTLLAALAYLGLQAWQRTNESRSLVVSRKAEPNSDAQLAALKSAHAAEGRNFETTTAIGNIYRDRSQEGLEGFKDLAQEAMQWFEKSIRLNPYDPHGLIGYGRSLDWIGQHKEAGEYFTKAEALDGNGYFTLAYVGWHHFQIGDYPTARTWLEKSQALMSDEKINPIPASYLKSIEEKLKAGPIAE